MPIRHPADRREPGVGRGPGARRPDPVAVADRVAAEDVARNRRLGAHGAPLVPVDGRVLTHCNAGALALRRLRHGSRRHPCRPRGRPTPVRLGRRDPTRAPGCPPHRVGARSARHPLPPGGRRDGRVRSWPRATSTSWSSARIASPPTATWPTRSARTGWPCWRTTTASRSTWPRLWSTDPGTPVGADIAIEDRDPDEVLRIGGARIAPDGAQAQNRAFDVTPAVLVTGYVTETGVIREATAGRARRPAVARSGSPSAQAIAHETADDALGQLIRAELIALLEADPGLGEAVRAQLGFGTEVLEQPVGQAAQHDLEGVSREWPLRVRAWGSLQGPPTCVAPGYPWVACPSDQPSADCLTPSSAPAGSILRGATRVTSGFGRCGDAVWRRWSRRALRRLRR